MDLETLLVAVYVIVDEWWTANGPERARGPGRPPSLSEAEALTLAIIAQWPRFRSERGFWRFADVHLRPYFPNLLSRSRLNRRIRALEAELGALQRDLAETLADGREAYRVLDTTLIPAIVRTRARRKGLFAGQASFGRSASKTEWVYGFKVGEALSAVVGPGRASVLEGLVIPRTTTEIARQSGSSPGTISEHLSRLRKAGLVEPHRRGRSVFYRLTPTGESLRGLFEEAE